MSETKKASITIMYPSDTSVTIVGDPYVVEQIVDRLHGQQIYYKARSGFEALGAFPGTNPSKMMITKDVGPINAA